MNKRKLLTLAMTLCMVAILAIGGTLAYFTDTEKVTNTMVFGNVEINIDEYQYDKDESKWEKYEDESFVLYPLENVQGQYLYNKSVRTYNTSPSQDAAYIRSFVLIEKNDYLPDDFKNEGGDDCFPGIHVGYDNREDSFTFSGDSKTHHGSKEAGHLEDSVTYNGNEYWVLWYVDAQEHAIGYNEALSSLHSVWIDKNITNDQLTGWGTDGVQVIAFSQAIQAEGLDHAAAMEALGEVTVANMEQWVADAEIGVVNDVE